MGVVGRHTGGTIGDPAVGGYDRGSGSDGRAYRYLQRLYDVSTRLTRFDRVDDTILDVVATIAAALSLRTVVVIVGADAAPVAHVWMATGVSPRRLAEAKDQARASYRYLVDAGADVSLDETPPHALPGLPGPEPDVPSTFITLPIAVRGRKSLGAMQLEGAAGFDETDLVFANAVANQLGVALARNGDIEARQASADAARFHAERAAALLGDQFAFVRDVTASLGEGILAVDLAGRVTLCNRTAADLLGVDCADASGRVLATLLEVRRADATVVDAADGPLEVAKRSAQVISSDEHLFVTGGRDPFPVSYTAAPIRQEGRVVGAVLSFRNIIDIKRAEFEQRLLADVSASVAASLDHRVALAAVARAAVPGFSDLCFIDEVLDDGTVVRSDVVFGDEVKQRLLAERVTRFAPRPGWRTPQQWAIENRRSRLVPSLGSPDTIAHDAEHADLMRAVGPTSLMVVPLCIRDRILGVITFISAESGRHYSARDLALAEEVAHRTAVAVDNARLYTAAQRATHARENLLHVVSHDLRTPLGVILMGTEVLAPLHAEGRTRKTLETMRHSATRMKGLITDLLDTGSIETGHLSVVLRSVDIASAVQAAIDELTPMAEGKSLTLASHGLDVPAVRADAARLHQVLANLLGNAIKFSPPGATVTVHGSATGGAVRLAVSDQGAGINLDEIPHLFDRFWKAPRTAHLGSGLGLFIVKGIVDAHGGRVWVESQPGQGSTFFVSLPVASPGDQGAGTG